MLLELGIYLITILSSMLVTFVVCMGIHKIYNLLHPKKDKPYRDIVMVYEGDSLYKIASLIKEPQENIYDVIEEIKKINNLKDDRLAQGQLLEIPRGEKVESKT